MMLDVMKTAAYRQQMMTVMEESIQSPLFRAQMVELLKSAIAQQSKPDQMPTAKSAQKKERRVEVKKEIKKKIKKKKAEMRKRRKIPQETPKKKEKRKKMAASDSGS